MYTVCSVPYKSRIYTLTCQVWHTGSTIQSAEPGSQRASPRSHRAEPEGQKEEPRSQKRNTGSQGAESRAPWFIPGPVPEPNQGTNEAHPAGFQNRSGQ